MKRALTSTFLLLSALSAVSVPASFSSQEFSASDDAKKVFGAVTLPSDQPTKSISTSPSCGCIAGAVGLPIDGKYWQVMRLQRNRRWGHPDLLRYIESLGERAHANGWNGLLIGDMSQPRGGPMVDGHASHQAGLDVDLWLDEMPTRTLDTSERNTKMQASSVLKPGTNVLDDRVWNEKRAQFIRDAAKDQAVARIFVTPAIKRALCNCKSPSGSDTEWLRRLRPWWDHDDHIHVRLHSPDKKIGFEQDAPPPGDGCGAEIDEWLLKTARNINGDDDSSSANKKPVIRLDSLPTGCIDVLKAPSRI
jgi:penicillin-insensitive murein endopeptidase